MSAALRKLLSFHRHIHGAMAVEFALVMPLFLLIVMGAIEFGRLYWIRGTMQFAIDEAARYAMVNTSATNSTIQTYATGKLYGLSSSTVTVAVTDQTISSVSYKVITATSTFTFLVGDILPYGSITLTRTSKAPVNL